MIIDAHMHIWDHVDGLVGGGKVPVKALGNGRVAHGKKVVQGMPATFVDCKAKAEMAVAEFDGAGVDTGVMVQEFLDGEQNDYCVTSVKRFPERFFVHGLVNWYDPKAAVKEAKALLGKGFRGIKLPAQHLPKSQRIDDQAYFPIYAAMHDAGAVLAVDLVAGDAQSAQLDTVLRQWPKLRVAIGHMGLVTRGDWYSQILLCRYENVYVETGGIIWLFRDEGYPFPGAAEAIRLAAKRIGFEKIMWGSDWPRTMVDFTYRQSLDWLRVFDHGFTEEQKALLLGGNAARLYKLKTPKKQREPWALITEG
jgi:predicted TIM-barrel fold metal-dependent hydrolase